MRRTIAAILVAVLAASATGAEDSDGALRTRLLGDLSSEAAAVREQAALRLDLMESLDASQIAEAIRTAGPRSRPLLLSLAASRGVEAAVPEIAASAAAADAVCAEAAIRALVTLGEDAVAAGRTALAASARANLPERERDARLRHMQALDVQNRVEREVLSRWRRKSGSYRGRYLALERFGWDAQPVLLAMLLDVPLEDQFVVVPTTGDEDVDTMERTRAITNVATSRRRGYRTFQPLPPTIEVDELFDLAQQALADVGDLRVMGDVLRQTRDDLLTAHRTAGWRPRQWEDQFAQDIEVILARRGDTVPLKGRRHRLEQDVLRMRRSIGGSDPEDDPEQFHFYTVRLGELAIVLHQLELWDPAADRYAEIVQIIRRLTGKEPSVAGYNRACALACGGRIDDALDQLARALDPAISSGMEDLTREWVNEDGDLEALRKDPRYQKILRKRFGP